MEAFALTVFALLCLEYGLRIIRVITTDGPFSPIISESTWILDTVLGVCLVIWGINVLF
jgi:hypothetical protein